MPIEVVNRLCRGSSPRVEQVACRLIREPVNRDFRLSGRDLRIACPVRISQPLHHGVRSRLDAFGRGQHDGFSRKRVSRNLANDLEHLMVFGGTLCRRMAEATSTPPYERHGVVLNVTQNAGRHRLQIQLKDSELVARRLCLRWSVVSSLLGLHVHVVENGRACTSQPLSEPVPVVLEGQALAVNRNCRSRDIALGRRWEYLNPVGEETTG